MNEFIINRCITLIFLISIFLTACGGTMSNSSVGSDLPTAIDSLIEKNQAPDKPGLAVVVSTQDKIIYMREQGLANVKSSKLIGKDTSFEIASLAKPFTAFGVMQLVSEGRVRVADSIQNYLPELPTTWSSITIHHLLSHQSGIPDFLNVIPYKNLDGMNNQNLIQHYINNPELDFTPGTKGSYSNANYVLLAEIIERVSGQLFPIFMKEKVFSNFNMSQSYIADPSESMALNNSLDSKPYGITYSTYGAINQISTINDLGNFAISLATKKVVTPQVWSLIATPHATFSDGSSYGYGFYIINSGNSLVHGGRLDGYRSLLYLNRKNGFVVAILGNGGSSVEALEQSILKLVRNSLE